MIHTFKRQQLLNITTGRLWTNMDDIYTFFDAVIEPGFMTHMLPNARRAFLSTRGTSTPFNALPKEGYDPINTPNEDISFEMTEDDRVAFGVAYNNLASPLEGKDLIVVKI